jgi:hypothetical protein
MTSLGPINILGRAADAQEWAIAFGVGYCRWLLLGPLILQEVYKSGPVNILGGAADV